MRGGLGWTAKAVVEGLALRVLEVSSEQARAEGLALRFYGSLQGKAT